MGTLSEPKVAVEYSPWYKMFPGSDPRVTGADEQAELDCYNQKLSDLKAWLPVSGPGSLGAVLLDSEKFHYTSSSSDEYKEALTRKHDLIYDATRLAYPSSDVRIEMYDRGAIKKNDVQSEWTPVTAYTLQEKGESLNVALYVVPEVWNMRESFKRTVDLAQAMSGWKGVNIPVTPWIELGGGHRRQASHSVTYMNDYAWDYDRTCSWQLGNEVNNPWYGDRPDRYAPWNAAEVIAFYPSVFDTRGLPAGPDGKSTHVMEHFVAYVRGANGLDGVSSDVVEL